MSDAVSTLVSSESKQLSTEPAKLTPFSRIIAPTANGNITPSKVEKLKTSPPKK